MYIGEEALYVVDCRFQQTEQTATTPTQCHVCNYNTVCRNTRHFKVRNNLFVATLINSNVKQARTKLVLMEGRALVCGRCLMEGRTLVCGRVSCC